MNVYTAPEYRRQGVAARVVRACIEDARARGAGSLLLESTQMGEPLYRSLGFAPAKGYMRLSLRDGRRRGWGEGPRKCGKDSEKIAA